MISTDRMALLRVLLWAGLGTAIVTAALIIWVDVPLALYMNAHRQTPWVNFFAAITDLASGVIWYPVSLAGIGYAYVRYKKRTPDPAAWRKVSRAWTFMLVTMLTSGAFINGVKLLVGRERPRLLFRDGTTGFHPFFGLDLDDSGFPSGHTQAIWAAMLCLSFIYPPLRPAFLIVAVLISASRVIVGAHYAGDVAGGMYVAVFAALIWRQWFERGGVSVTLCQPKAA